MQYELANGEQNELLQARDPAPYSFINMTGGRHALLLGDHAGQAIPASRHNLGLDSQALERHIAFDIGTRQMIELLSRRLNLPALLANYSRLVVDLNRNLEDPTAFPETSDGTEIPGNQNLDAREKKRRVEAIYQPYHCAIDQWVTEAKEHGQTPALISIHSFTPAMKGFFRPWEIGILYDKDPRIAASLLRNLQTYKNINVGDNQPYSGKHLADFTIDHHAEAAGLPYAGIEIRQDLLQSESGIEYWVTLLGGELAKILSDPSLYTRIPRTEEADNRHAHS